MRPGICFGSIGRLVLVYMEDVGESLVFRWIPQRLADLRLATASGRHWEELLVFTPVVQQLADQRAQRVQAEITKQPKRKRDIPEKTKAMGEPLLSRVILRCMKIHAM